MSLMLMAMLIDVVHLMMTFVTHCMTHHGGIR